MPRYRFAWSNFSPSLLKKLAAALRLDGQPAEALRDRYGARPKTDFIKAAWPTLLAVWLPADGASRQSVVKKLTTAGLGRTEMPRRTRQAQLDYLSSCRNSPRLREVVLGAFLASGEPLRMPAPSVGPPADAGLSPSIESVGTHEAQEPVSSARDEATAADQQPPDFDTWLEATLKHELNLPEVRRDQDGDIPIPRGSSVLFIRPREEESPFLEVFAPILRGFEMSSDVYEAVNSINAQVPMAKAMVFAEGREIFLSAHLPVDTLSPRELMFTIDLVSGAADHFDTLLQKRFGGETMLPDDHDAIEV